MRPNWLSILDQHNKIMELQQVLNIIATDIFRNQGDCDFIAARSNFKLRLRQQFLWTAQQCIEKYLKAILLFNGQSILGYGHNLCALNKAVKNIQTFKFELQSDQEQFLNYLSTQGENRYLTKTAYNNGNELSDLDSTVWQIRRYCQYMTDRGLGCNEAIPGMREAVLAAALNSSHRLHPQKFSLFNGYLEEVLKRAKNDPTRKALVWNNLFYGAKKRKRLTYLTFGSSEIPPNKRGWSNVDWREVEEYVKLR